MSYVETKVDLTETTQRRMSSSTRPPSSKTIPKRPSGPSGTAKSWSSTSSSAKRATKRPTFPDPKEYLSKDRPTRLIADAEAPEAAVEDLDIRVEVEGVKLPQRRATGNTLAAKKPQKAKKGVL